MIKTGLHKHSLTLLIFIISSIFSVPVFAQCTWNTIDFDNFEGAAPIPFVDASQIYGSGTHSAGSYNGALGLWLNVQNGFPAQLDLYNRPYTVCPGQSYQFTAWIGGTSGADYAIDIYEGTNITGTPIASYTSYDSWVFQTIGSFIPTTTTVSLVIRNNIAGGVGLNDFRMDDLSLQLCVPDPIDNSINLCSNSSQVALFDSLPVLMGTAGVWAGPSGLTGGFLGSFDPTLMTSGTYTYTVSGSATCPDSINTVSTTISNGPDLSTTDINQSCGVNSADITSSFIDNNASGGVVTYWQDPAATIPELNPNNILIPGSYYIVIDAGGCSDTASLAVSFQTASTIDLGNDTSFCSGQSTVLNATAGFDHYLWNDNSTNQTLTASSAGTYWVQASTLGTNIVSNGDFSSGNSGFGTDYTVGMGGTWGAISNPGTYLVTTNANLAHNNFSNCVDHTSGTGNMMVINGADIPNQNVWCQTVAITANTDYEFSTWIQNYDLPNPAQLSFFINGVQIGATFSPTTAGCTWQNFFEIWNSGAATSAQICIVNQSLAGGGNDFALDDISFSPLCTAGDTLTIAINSASISIDTQIACNNFTWIDGINYTASNSSATHTLVNGASNGCDSIITLNLTLTSPVISTDTQIACNNFTWIDGINYTASNSSASDTIFGGANNGCDSIVTLNLTITSSVNSTDNQIACNNYTWINGINYTSSNTTATDTIYGGSINGCDSIITLNLTITSAVNSTDKQIACNNYTWINGINYTSSNTTATDTISGGSINGCDSIITLNLTITNPVNSIDTYTSCNNFTWIDGVNYTSSNNTATHTILAGASNGCDSIITLNLTITNPVNSIDTYTSCNSFTWIDGVNYSSSNNTATHTVIAGASNGCDSIITLNLTITNPVNSIDTYISCNNFTWIDGVNYTSSNNTATHTILAGASNGCDSIITLNLTIINPASSIDTYTSCNSFSWIDGVNYTSSNNTATHTITGGAINGCDSIITLNFTLSDAVNSIDIQTSCVSFTWIDGITYTTSNNTATYTILNGAYDGCDSIVNLNLIISSDIPISLGQDIYTCEETVSLSPGTNFSSYLWNNGSNNSTLTTDEYGIYQVTVTDLDGCTGFDEIEVHEDCPSYIWIPKAFSPNNDSKNETFKVVGYNIEDFTLKVFNRWGNLLFETNNIDNGWDGTYKGSQVPTGIYAYKVDYSYSEKSNIISESVAGSVTLLK
jgi:gliding motility-associated-like protein